MATTIGPVTVAAGPLRPEGRLCRLEVARPGALEQADCQLNPDEVRALIDALTPYARRRPPWRGGKRTP